MARGCLRATRLRLTCSCAHAAAACVLEQIEQSIKEGALELLKKDRKRFAEVLSFEPGSFNQDMPTPDEISKLTVADIKVDLADFFDLLSGE